MAKKKEEAAKAAGDSKKGKKGKKNDKVDVMDDVENETQLASVDLDAEVKVEVQYTDTSYTSASFESLPPEMLTKPRKRPKVIKSGSFGEKLDAGSSEDFYAEAVPEELEEEQKKKKKGKGKKKKKKEDAIQIPKFPKPKNWKSMNPKQRKDWLAEMTAEYLQQLEDEKQAFIQEAKDRREAFNREMNEMLVRDYHQQDIRYRTLRKTVELFDKYHTLKINYDRSKAEEAIWRQYLKCDGLPDPRVVVEMNTYISLWNDIQECDVDELAKRAKEVEPLMKVLDEIKLSKQQYTEREHNNFCEVLLNVRNLLTQTVEFATYYLLRNIECRLVSQSLTEALYEREITNLCLNLWVNVRMPTRKPVARPDPPEPLVLTFPKLNVTLVIPKEVDKTGIAVRVAVSQLDLFSENCRTMYRPEEIPSELITDLYSYTVKEQEISHAKKATQEEIRKEFFTKVKARVKELEDFINTNKYLKNIAEKEELEQLQIAEPEGMVMPRDYAGEVYENKVRGYIESCMFVIRGGEVNMRKYRILAGIRFVDLLIQPPQPKGMRHGIELCTLLLPKKLLPLSFRIHYKPPAPPPPEVIRTPEEIEEELKMVQKEYEKLALINIQLPEDVLWLEPPVICQYNGSRKFWMTDYINDYKFNEDKLSLSFRTGVLWPIGIAMNKYANLPYQGWEMKPNPKGKGVILSITGLSVMLTWLIKGRKVKLTSAFNPTGVGPLKPYMNKSHTVAQMIQLLRKLGVDMFPDVDGHNLVEGTCLKHLILESHQYRCMAFLSRAYEFQWSRWNNGVGFRKIVVQAREAIDKRREGVFQLLLASPLRCVLLQCSELSPEFEEEPLLGMKFYADLFALNLGYGSSNARRATFDIDYQTVECTYEMLNNIKPCSFSS